LLESSFVCPASELYLKRLKIKHVNDGLLFDFCQRVAYFHGNRRSSIFARSAPPRFFFGVSFPLQMLV
jgi:hypothetical protein